MKKLSYAVLIFGLMLVASSASAQDTGLGANSTWRPPTQITVSPGGYAPTTREVGDLGYAPLEPLYSGQRADVESGNFGNLINRAFLLMISFGALLAVVMLVIGGIQYMTSTAIGTKATGLERAKAALLGILILAGSFIILNTINPSLTSIKFDLRAITPSNRASTQVNVNQYNGIKIYNGHAYEKVVELQQQCSPKKAIATESGTDNQGEYTIYKCL